MDSSSGRISNVASAQIRKSIRIRTVQQLFNVANGLGKEFLCFCINLMEFVAVFDCLQNYVSQNLHEAENFRKFML